MLAQSEDAVLVVVDMQPTFLAPIFERQRVFQRSQFLIEAAKILGVPVIATEQYPERMGGTDPELLSLLKSDAIPKLAFSCMGSDEFAEALNALGRSQVILCGIETHICVNQTAHDMLEDGFDVFIAADACSSRTLEMHKLGLKRLRDEGVTLAHSESVIYEWMRTAAHPAFRDVLALVKKQSTLAL